MGFKEALCLSIKNTFVNLTLPVPIPDEEKKLTLIFILIQPEMHWVGRVNNALIQISNKVNNISKHQVL